MEDVLKRLSEPTPKDEIKFREGQVFHKKNEQGEIVSATATMLCYVDARYVMDRLDDILGPEGWRNEYKEIKGNLYCGISIFVNGEWITKWDVGVESKFEPQKGEASDSFKRSAVHFGIGRDLYSMGRFKAELQFKYGRWVAPYGWKPHKWDDDSGMPAKTDEIPPHRRPTKKVVSQITELVVKAHEYGCVDADILLKAENHVQSSRDRLLDKNTAETVLSYLQGEVTDYEIKLKEKEIG